MKKLLLILALTALVSCETGGISGTTKSDSDSDSTYVDSTKVDTTKGVVDSLKK